MFIRRAIVISRGFFISGRMNLMNQDSVREYFAGKKITLMGLGLLGRGLGDAKFLAEAGAELIVTDLKTEAELTATITQLKEFPNITYHLGEHRMEDFENRDLVIRAPNAPLDSPFLAHARELGVPVEMDASLFVKLTGQYSPATIIVGVTGTRGKSTVTHLIYEMARAAFATTTHKAYLGGNVKDIATLPLLEVVGDGDMVILELDSWQLQGFEEDKISPPISVWTNFMPDHMNYYHGDMDRYFQDKAAIARSQKKGDYFIAPQNIKEKIEARFGPLAANYHDPFAKAGDLPDDWEIALPGDHNRKNAAFAVAAAQRLGIADEIIKNILKTFGGLPNRLELLGEKQDILFYNDSNSTTPEATIAALNALAPQRKPITLIAGGTDKEMIFTDLITEIERTVQHSILFKGTATEKLKTLLPKDFSITLASSMDEAFQAALATTQAGGIILLSPGATSFGIFQNEYDRGDQFRAAFEKLK
jgi:UDP-N-acetylmuramoylalanine--D-glutamate ligase